MFREKGFFLNTCMTYKALYNYYAYPEAILLDK